MLAARELGLACAHVINRRASCTAKPLRALRNSTRFPSIVILNDGSFRDCASNGPSSASDRVPCSMTKSSPAITRFRLRAWRWRICRTLSRANCRDIRPFRRFFVRRHYVAPVGEKEAYVENALKHLFQYLPA